MSSSFCCCAWESCQPDSSRNTQKTGYFHDAFSRCAQGRKRFNYKKPQKTNLCNGNGNSVFPCDPAAILSLLTKKPQKSGICNGNGSCVLPCGPGWAATGPDPLTIIECVERERELREREPRHSVHGLQEV